MSIVEVRNEDRRDLAFGFLTLVAMMAAHALLETARDALFLAGLPATDLPWAYLAIATLAAIALRGQQYLLGKFANRRLVLSASLLAGAFVTVGFWASIEASGPWSLLAFYVWTGLLSTVLVVQFWLLLDESLTVTSAKRIFPWVAAGGVAGAILGSLGAELLLRVIAPRGLLLAGAGLLIVAAVIPALLAKGPEGTRDVDPLEIEEAFSLRSLLGDTYLAKLFVLVLVATISVTAADFIFKSEVAEHIVPDALGTFFARFYLSLNSVALLIQLVGARWLLQTVGVHRSAAALPLLLLATTLGFLVGPGLIGAIALKAVDGSLRHSLYRSAVEVLYLPLGSARRQRAKALIDGFGHRGGQAIASLLILACVTVGLSTTQIAVGLLAPVAVWLFTVFALRSQYEGIFRARLREGALETRFELQELDLHSLEVLLGALNSPQDREVLAAIDLFDAHGRAKLIPVLILYHPCLEVRQRALQVFSEARDTRFLPIARRLLEDEDCDIRAAALRAITAVRPDPELLNERLDEEAPMVEATALIGLLSLEAGPAPRDLHVELQRRIREGTVETRTALARAIRDRPSDVFHEALVELARVGSLPVELEAAAAMEENPDARYLPHLLPWLGESRLRPAARRVMLAIGPPTLPFLDSAMKDERLSRKVRRHIPRTISRFESAEAAHLLVRHLETERDGAVRFKILRGLGRIRVTKPGIRLDQEALDDLLRETLARAVQLARWCATVEAHGVSDVATSRLLGLALRDKERSALERSFRLMAILDPREDFELVWRGLESEDRRVRSAGREVLDTALDGSVREAVLALIDDRSAGARANTAAAALGISLPKADLEQTFRAMLEDDSTAIRCIVAHEAAERQMTSLTADLEQVAFDEHGPLRESIEHALELLRESTAPSEEGSRA